MRVRILGTRGIPAEHGGFETFAEHLSLYLVARGHEVTVYCQVDREECEGEDEWCGIRRVKFRVPPGPLGTILFDWRSVWHARGRPGVILTLGYNTAVFSLLYAGTAVPTLMNMDGIEWSRQKWSRWERLWLRGNEYMGAQLSQHLIADHPEIGKHLEAVAPRDKITVIPYGADAVKQANPDCLKRYGVQPYQFALCIARPEPENSILEIVAAFSRREHGYPLLVLGKFKPETDRYHDKVMSTASDEVWFPGAIYDKETVKALRFFASYYVHGHRVGGTNPSLVEALASGSPIVAHENRFNRWVAGPGAQFFTTEEDLVEILAELERRPAELDRMRDASVERHASTFPLERVHGEYEHLLQRFGESRYPTV